MKGRPFAALAAGLAAAVLGGMLAIGSIIGDHQPGGHVSATTTGLINSDGQPAITNGLFQSD